MNVCNRQVSQTWRESAGIQKELMGQDGKRHREMMRKQPMLLSVEEKNRFFNEMDTFLAPQASRRRRRDGQKVATSRENSTPAPKSVMTHEPVGRGAHSEAATSTRTHNDIIHSTTTTPQAPMVRTLPVLGGKRRVSTSSAASSAEKEKPKRTKRADAKRASSLDPQDQLLRGQRVLLVPIGSDVSRRRLEIWQEMVHALGGTLVSVSQSTTTPEKLNESLLHISSNSRGVCGKELKTKRMELDVDIVIASAQVDAQRLQHHYLENNMLPASVKIYTPEWLVYVRQEKKLPEDEREYEWRHQRDVLQQQEDEHQVEEEPAKTMVSSKRRGGNDSDEEDNDDGSDKKNVSSNEIQRALPACVDGEKIRKEEEELQIKKDKLVNERIPIFHKLNPRFETIANADQAQKLRMEAFVCQKSSLMQANLNSHLTDPLEELMEFLHVERDIWREYSYKKVVSSLKAMRSRICSVRDLKGEWWAKGRMRDKVVELLETGKLEKLEAKKTNPRLKTLVEMSRIWGVGPATAAKLYNLGYKSMDALRANAEEVLNPQQQIGLKRYHDFLTKIPRSEVQEIEKTVVDEVHRLIPNATALACGSYRRGKPSSGDCDILITDPDSEECDILPELLRRLHDIGFLTDDLTHVSDHRMGRCDSYMGVCQLRASLPHRRLDIKVYPRRYFGFALLYFTGSDHFNRSMRLFARKKGWSLSDRYLKRVVRVRKGVKIEAGESVVCPHEVDVFIALGLEYKDPTERNCFDIRFLDEDEAMAKKRKSSGGAEELDTSSMIAAVAATATQAC